MFLIFLFILGLVIGSFLNVLIDRLPNEESINGRSHCDYCKKTLSAGDLIPVVSYVWLKGKCRYCKKKLSIQYPLIEIFTGIVFILIWHFVGSSVILGNVVTPESRLWTSQSDILKICYLGIISTLIVIFFADVKYHIIPDSMQIAFFVFSLLFIFVGNGLKPFPTLTDHLISGLITLAPILFIFLITRGRGMGFGDVKLAFIIGFFLGLWPGLMALYIAFILGAVWGVAMILFKRRGLKSKIAFGPFLVLGIVCMLVWGDGIMSLAKNYYPFLN
ncbi:MAG: prepilin peptidase [bacterium]|nr:prepilin peptidase [bacterium]